MHFNGQIQYHIQHTQQLQVSETKKSQVITCFLYYGLGENIKKQVASFVLNFVFRQVLSQRQLQQLKASRD